MRLHEVLGSLNLIHQLAGRSKYCACLLRGNLGYLDLSLPVLDTVLEFDGRVLLVNEFKRVGHVCNLELQCLLLLLQIAGAVDFIARLLYVLLCPHLLVLLGLHVAVYALLHPHGVLELLLEGVECLHGLARVQLEGEELLIALVDVLHVLLVLYLQLMEVDELEVVAHLLLVLDLRLGLGDLRLKRGVLQGQLPDERVLGPLFVLHVLHELFGIVFASASILGCGEESTEIEGFLSYFSNCQVGTLKDGLKSLQQCLRAISAAFNTLLECLQLSVSDLVLLLGCEAPLVVDECPE